MQESITQESTSTAEEVVRIDASIAGGVSPLPCRVPCPALECFILVDMRGRATCNMSWGVPQCQQDLPATLVLLSIAACCGLLPAADTQHRLHADQGEAAEQQGHLPPGGHGSLWHRHQGLARIQDLSAASNRCAAVGCMHASGALNLLCLLTGGCSAAN